MKKLLAILATCLLATGAQAHSITAGDLKIIHPYIPQPSASAKAAAAYVEITNSGSEADRLIGVEVSVAQSAMLHQSTVNADGVASMAHVDFIDLPPGATTMLEPGGYHVMLMAPDRPLIEGEMVPGALIFEKAGRVEVEFAVDPPGGMDHSTMDHSADEGAAVEGHGAHAHGHGAAAPVMTGDAVTDIEALLKAQFDSADNPLTVAPITVQGDVALAGWSQGGAGGRAFLRKDAEGWFVELCAGSALLMPETLTSLGVSAEDASAALAAHGAAEAALGAEQIALFDSFDGMMMIGRDGHQHGG